MEDLSDAGRRFTLQPTDILVRQGDEADDVFLVVTGALAAVKPSANGEVVVGTVTAGQVVGEVTVVAGGRRTATLRAVETTEVLAIERVEFERWLIENPAIADSVSAQARGRIDRGHVAAMVADLVGADEADLVQEVVDRVDWHRLRAGEVLFEEGDQADAAYFIVGGRVLATVKSEAGETPVAELGRGEVVGELGLLDDAPRSATVRAVRDTTLAVFPTAVFEELVTRSPGLMLHVARGILTRLRRTPRRLVGRAASITLAITTPNDATGIVDGIAAEISRFGSVRTLSSERVDAFLSRDGISQAEADNVGVPRLAEFIHEADVGNDYVVLEADRELSGWTRRALRQADRVVIVCSPRPQAAERALISGLLAEVQRDAHVAVMLAVVHPADTARPRGTAALLDEFGLDDVTHVRAGSDADVARLARLASGNGVGLVLSGGGARGFAHLGVYRAVIEAGIPVDAVAGCSIGAPLAGGIAQGVPLDRLVPVSQRQFHKLLDYTLPVVSLVKGERISASIEESFGGWDIEDLWMRYYCVSTNLTKSRLEVHRRGDTARAVRASVAIPGILPPVPDGDDLLVDGGVLNNLPFETMRADGMIDTVIAIDVAPARGPRAKAEYGLSVSGFNALVDTVRRRGSYPSVAAILLRSMLAGSVHNQKQALLGDAVDLLVRLDLPGVSLLEFERVAEVAERGYRAARETVEEWAAGRAWLGPTA
jgi:predicted acylesterase/phospholipase RssA/CRP-like cAMP-binding protein